jgi:cell division protein FtsW
MFLSSKRAHAPDYVIIFCAGLLLLTGLVVLASASSHVGVTQYEDGSFFLKRQLLLGVLPGLLGFFVAFKLPYDRLSKRGVSVGLLCLSIVLLLLVFTPLGLSAKGATRWLAFGSFSFQPAELLKISLVLYLGSWLAFKDHRQQSWKQGLLPFAVVLTVVSSILVIQRSTSPVAMLMGVALVMYFMSGAKIRYLGAIVGAGLLSLALIVAITPYRAQRILTYLNPEADAQGSGYQLLQAKTAIGAGGLFGVGYGQSVVKQRLPEAIGDSIFAVIGEEFGFIGSLFIIGLFATLVFRMLYRARILSDPFGRLLLIGFATTIGLQAFVNIGAMTGLLPLTGTPLPFISYGGTSLAVLLTMMGIVANVSKHASR